MSARLAGFRGEFQWELEIAESQLLALAGVIPDSLLRWRPAPDARSFSEVLVHLGVVNLLLLELKDAARLDMARIAALVRGGIEKEKGLVDRVPILDLVSKSFAAVKAAISSATEEELDRRGEFFAEQSTVRRVYLRVLAHSHEHMGQLIAYARSNGVPVPWPDPLREFDSPPTTEAS